MKMKSPKGKNTYHSHRYNKTFRKDIHGLSYCKCCKTLFSRDYIAAMNICRSFVRYFQYDVPLDYLRKLPWTRIVVGNFGYFRLVPRPHPCDWCLSENWLIVVLFSSRIRYRYTFQIQHPSSILFTYKLK